MKFEISKLKPETWHAALAVGSVDASGFYLIIDQQKILGLELPPAAADIVPVQISIPFVNNFPARNHFFQWPQPLKDLSAKSVPTDKGMGDVIKREIGWYGDAKFEAWFETIFKKCCAGKWTVEEVNSKYPLPIK